MLKSRTEHGIDPMTGTTLDAVTGGEHIAPRNAAAFKSDKALVFAEDTIHQSDEFAAKIPALLKEGDSMVVYKPLKEIFGDNYLDHVHGRTDSVASNQGSVQTDLINGSVRANYQYSGDSWNLVTMHPQIASKTPTLK